MLLNKNRNSGTHIASAIDGVCLKKICVRTIHLSIFLCAGVCCLVYILMYLKPNYGGIVYISNKSRNTFINIGIIRWKYKSLFSDEYFKLYTRCLVRVQKVWISLVQIIEVPTLYTPIENALLH